jgi:hypothetical protein
MGKRRHPGKVAALAAILYRITEPHRPIVLNRNVCHLSGKRQPPGSPEDSFPRR